MSNMMIAKWNYAGWEPLAWVSNDKAFKDAWDNLSSDKYSIRGFKMVQPAEPGMVYFEYDEEVRKMQEAEVWEMMSLEEQARLTVDYPIGR